MQRCGLSLIVCVLLILLAQSSLSARTWYIKVDGTGDAPTIQAGTDSASHGDTILVGPGTYNWNNQGGNEYGMISILRESADMTIVSESGPGSTTLDGQFVGRIIFFQGETELTVDGFTLTRGQATTTGAFTGGAFAAHFSSPVVKNCVFINNNGNNGGAYWYGGFGTPQITDCRFEANSATTGGAIYLINSPQNTVVSNCTIINNSATTQAGAIFMYNFKVSIEQCTFAQNTAPGRGGAILIQNSPPTTVTNCTFYMNLGSPGAAISCFGASAANVDKSILALGLGGGAIDVDATSTMTFSCSDIWGNIGGDWVGAIAGQLGTNGNFSADPLFCAPVSNLYLNDVSPCAPGNHPDGDSCDIIGAHDVACGTVPVEQRTWGAIKSLYAE